MHNPEHEKKNERHLNAFRTQRGTHQDHHRPTSASPTKFDGDRICERKSKGTFQRTSDLRPIMNTWMDGTTSFTPSASSRTTEHGPTGPPVADGTICRTGKARAWGNTLPSYDPILHVVTAQSTSSTAQSLRQRENDRLWGTLGIKHRSPPQGSYDPIRHHYTADPSATSTAASKKSTVAAKTPILVGETWGQRDPIRGEWTMRPHSAASPRVMDAVQSGCAANSQRGRVPTPKSQGVYDPIKNSWISPPQDSRIVEGLSYAPRGIFSTYGRTL